MKIAIIGAGAIGGAIAEGLLKSDFLKADDLTISNPTAQKLERFAKMGARVTTDNAEAAHEADVLIIAVKPWLVEEVLTALDTTRKTVVSVAAGITSEQLLQWVSLYADLWLAIPNIAASERASMTFLVPVKNTVQCDVEGLFKAVGRTFICPERLLPGGTTLASCGLAYAMRYVRASTEGGVELGFRAHEAQEIVLQTVLGVVRLLQASGMHPEQAVDLVTTPGGLTIRGLNEMERAGFSSAVIRGLKAGM